LAGAGGRKSTPPGKARDSDPGPGKMGVPARLPLAQIAGQLNRQQPVSGPAGGIVTVEDIHGSGPDVHQQKSRLTLLLSDGMSSRLKRMFPFKVACQRQATF